MYGEFPIPQILEISVKLIYAWDIMALREGDQPGTDYKS